MVSAREAFFNAPAKRASRRSQRERNSVAAHFLERDLGPTCLSCREHANSRSDPNMAGITYDMAMSQHLSEDWQKAPFRLATNRTKYRQS